MHRLSITDVCRLVKYNFVLAIRNNALLAVLYLLLIPVIRGISNLDAYRSAMCLEQSVIIIGIILLVPITGPEHSPAIREMILTRVKPHWRLILLRYIMAMLLLTVLTALFTAIMLWNKCSFPYIMYVSGTVISAAALGNTGMFAASICNSNIEGYLVAIGYFLMNFLGYIPESSVFSTFAACSGDIASMYFTGSIGLVMIAAVLLHNSDIIKRLSK